MDINFFKTKLKRLNFTNDCGDLRRFAELCGKLRTIAEYYGEANQIVKTSEEMAELNQVLMKYLQKGNTIPAIREKVIEEMADVEIMLEQLCYLWGVKKSELLAIMEIKADRQIARMAANE